MRFVSTQSRGDTFGQFVTKQFIVRYKYNLDLTLVYEILQARLTIDFHSKEDQYCTDNISVRGTKNDP